MLCGKDLFSAQKEFRYTTGAESKIPEESRESQARATGKRKIIAEKGGHVEKM